MNDEHGDLGVDRGQEVEVPVEQFLQDPVAERQRRLHDLAAAYRLFGVFRWGDLGDGHVTCRDTEQPDHMWLLRHEVSFDRAQPQDMVLIAPDGSAMDQTGKPAEINQTAYYIHYPIHEARPEVTSVAHVHTPWGTPFAAQRRMIKPLSQESCAFFEDHALYEGDDVQVMSLDGGKRIAAALGECRAVILANHGLLTVGASAADAVGWFVFMERVAEVQIKARSGVPISAEAARLARDDLVRGDLGWSLFMWAGKRHLGFD